MKFIFKGDDIIERKEDEEYTLLLNKNNNYQLALNSTGKEIFNLVKCKNDSEEIIQQMCQIYPSAPSNQIEKDVLEILDSFNVYGVIEYIDQELKKIENGSVICEFSGDKNYRACSEFIKSNVYGEYNLFQYVITDDFQTYSPVSLRLRVMRNMEYQVFVKKDNVIIAFMSFSNSPEGISRVVAIKDLVFGVDISDQDKIEALNMMISKVVSMYNKHISVSKIRVATLKNENESLKNLISKIGFKEEAYLKNEMMEGDVQFISKMI